MRRRQSFVGDTMHELYLQDKGPTIHAILEFDEVVNVSILKNVLESKMVPYPRFSSRLDKSGHYWENVSVDINQHIEQVTLELDERDDEDTYKSSCKREGGYDGGEEDFVLKSVEKYVGSVLHKRFNPDLPLWTVTVLSHPSIQRSFVLFRISHSIGDGIILCSLLLSLAEPDTDVKTIPSPRQPPSSVKANDRNGTEINLKRKSNGFRKSITQLISFFVVFFNVFKLPLKIAHSCLRLMYTFFGRDDKATVIKPEKLSDLGDVKLFARGEPISVVSMKAIARAAVEANYGEEHLVGKKYTVNDVLMASIAGGVRRYSQLRQHATGHVKHRFPVRFLSIVNTRSSKGLSNERKMLADYAAGKFGNEFSHFVIDMDVGPMLPHKRLDQVNEIMSNVKQSPEGIITNYANKLTWLIGGSWLLEKSTKYFFSKFQSFVSNLMAPQIPLKFAGAKLKYLYNCTSPMVFGCTFNVMSYNQNLIVSVACDAKVVPTPKELLSCVEAEFNALQTDLLGLPFQVPNRLKTACESHGLTCGYEGISLPPCLKS